MSRGRCSNKTKKNGTTLGFEATLWAAADTGRTVLGIRQSELRKIELPIPPLSEQRAISRILCTLDDKIKLNSRMNEALEAIACAPGELLSTNLRWEECNL